MKAKKSLGQNFLTDKNKINAIVNALPNLADFTVVEVGPGTGAVTKKIVDMAKQIIAIEIDTDMIDILNEIENNNFKLINEDILKINWEDILPKKGNLQFISNLPYYISTKIMFKVALEPRFEYMSIMLQKELVDRIVANPGTRTFGRLSVSVNSLFQLEEKIKVPRGSFSPAPNVDSVFIVLKRKDINFDVEKYFNFIKAAFGLKRKTLINSLKKYSPEIVNDVLIELEKRDIKINIRAEQIDVDTYISIFNSINI